MPNHLLAFMSFFELTEPPINTATAFNIQAGQTHPQDSSLPIQPQDDEEMKDD